jgi:hypothetical protein
MDAAPFAALDVEMLVRGEAPRLFANARERRPGRTVVARFRMRDAAGDSGEFYTPRAVVRFMVEVTDPQLGETVLDPAAGTGGFLVEAFTHMGRRVKTATGHSASSSNAAVR